MLKINPIIESTVNFAEYLQATAQYTHKLQNKILKAEGQTAQEWAQERIDASRGDY